MTRLRSWLLGVLAVLLAGPAAANWSRQPDGTVADCSLTSRNTCYYNFSDTTDSPILATGMCESVTILFNSDTTAITTGAEGNVRSCVSSTVSTNTCNIVYSDAGAVTLNGDPSTGRAAIYGIVADWIYFDVTANAGSDAARVQAICVRD